jgi:hypothetical protein
MYRFLIPLITSILLIAGSAGAGDFEVMQVLTDSEQVVLYNRNTGEEWVAETGDEIEGWKIVEIGSDSVTVFKPQVEEGPPALIKTVPVKGKRHIREVVQKKQRGGIFFYSSRF